MSNVKNTLFILLFIIIINTVYAQENNTKESVMMHNKNDTFSEIPIKVII